MRFAGVGTAASEGAITDASWGMFWQSEYVQRCTGACHGLFHGPVRAKPLSGRLCRAAPPAWLASAGAAQTVSVSETAAAATDIHFPGARMCRSVPRAGRPAQG